MLHEIVKIHLKQILDFIEKEKGIEVEVSDDAKREIEKQGFDPAYGVRPLKRVIQTAIVDNLAEGIISGKVKEGDKVKIDYKDGKFTVEKK